MQIWRCMAGVRDHPELLLWILGPLSFKLKRYHPAPSTLRGGGCRWVRIRMVFQSSALAIMQTFSCPPRMNWWQGEDQHGFHHWSEKEQLQEAPILLTVWNMNLSFSCELNGNRRSRWSHQPEDSCGCSVVTVNCLGNNFDWIAEYKSINKNICDNNAWPVVTCKILGPLFPNCGGLWNNLCWIMKSRLCISRLKQVTTWGRGKIMLPTYNYAAHTFWHL